MGACNSKPNQAASPEPRVIEVDKSTAQKDTEGMWRMTGGPHSPLFAEWLQLANEGGWQSVVQSDALTVGPGDCLVVVDMQNDFVPASDDINPDGGAFGVAEGQHVAAHIVRLMEYFAASGANVVATRDYHPIDHCSFIPSGGPFPPHCIQGSVGSQFYKPIAACLKELQNGSRPADVVFKGYHEDVDSFGGFEYPDNETSWSRVTKRDVPERLHGCALCAWTGCVSLKCSNMQDDVNAPPDVLAAHRSKKLSELLQEQNVKRIFACGLALDFCVLDTVLNAKQAGFEEVFMVLDAARAAHLPGIGQVGSGFLQAPADLKEKMASVGAKACPIAALLPSTNFMVDNPMQYLALGTSFPNQFGPFAMIPAPRLNLELGSGSYKVVEPQPEIEMLKQFSIKAEGILGPLSPFTLGSDAKKAFGLPETVTKFCWAYPVDQGTLSAQAHGYLSVTTPSGAFLVLGGFVYCDEAGSFVAGRSLAIGSGLKFGAPEPWKAAYTEALGDRWQSITSAALKAKGALKFAWINPGEELASSEKDGAPWKVCEHGAFAYRFGEDCPSDQDIVFPVLPFEEMKPAYMKAKTK